MSSTSSDRIEPDLVVSHKFPEGHCTYSERDVALYALGVGACLRNAVDEKELNYVYHENGQSHIKVLPTFAVLFPQLDPINFIAIPGLKFNPSLLLHGQQYLEIHKPLPTACQVQNRAAVVGLHDKGKAAVLEIETTSYDANTGKALCMNRTTVYLRGAGRFSESSSYTYSTNTKDLSFKIPKSAAFAVYEECTQPSQALLYRLSGDYNPLHSDPTIASFAGFRLPILHGLCTLGFAVRAVIGCCCNGDTNRVKAVLGRFLLHVFPGETLITEMWIDGSTSRVLYQTKVKGRNQAVLSGFVTLNRIQSLL